MSEPDATTEKVPGLRSRPFLLYMGGSFISWAGDWMDLAALNWAVLQITESPFSLGLINACRLIPVFVLSFPAGVLADRYDRRRLLMTLQGAMMALTFVVGSLVAWHAPFWLFVVIITTRSILGAVALPMRTALLANLVPPSVLHRAVAMQATVMSISRTVGLAAAAALLALVPLEVVFWVNAASYIVVLASLVLVRPWNIDPSPVQPGQSKSSVSEAVDYLRSNPLATSLLVLAVAPMVFGFPYQTLMPVFARDLLGTKETGYGMLLSLAAAGALAASSWLIFGRAIHWAGRWLVLSLLAFGFGLVLFTLAGDFILAAVLAFLVGLSSQLYRTMSRITIQVQTPDHLRGRILGIALMDRGFIPLGTMLLGAVAEWAGATAAGLVMGGGCIAVTLLVLLVRPQLWQIELGSSPRRS